MSSLELTEEIENALEENLIESEDEQEMFVEDSSPTDIPDFSEGRNPTTPRETSNLSSFGINREDGSE